MIIVQIFVWIGSRVIYSWLPAALSYFFVIVGYVFLIPSDNNVRGLNVTILVLSCISYAGQMRDNELLSRSIFKVSGEKEIQRKLIAILQQIPDGIIISDKNKCVYLNEKAQIMMGQEVRKNYWGQNSE